MADAERSSVSASVRGVAVAETRGPQHNQAVIVAIISAVGVILAALIPVLLSRNGSGQPPTASVTVSSPSGAATASTRSVETLGGPRLASLVLEDDFSTTLDRWPHLTETRRSAGYASGTYEIAAAAKAETSAFLRRDKAPSAGDVLVQVDGRLTMGKAGNGYGLICRATDQENYYRFNITNDGYYGIFKVQDGNETALRGPSKSTAISSSHLNQIQALCVSYSDPPRTELRLWINGTAVENVVDDSRPVNGYQVGLYARDVSGGGTRWEFDNFQLWELTG